MKPNKVSKATLKKRRLSTDVRHLLRLIADHRGRAGLALQGNEMEVRVSTMPSQGDMLNQALHNAAHLCSYVRSFCRNREYTAKQPGVAGTRIITAGGCFMTQAWIPVFVITALCAGCTLDATTAKADKEIQEPDHGWVSLFDGKTLTGWQVLCRAQDKDKNYWKVEDGALCADVPKGSKHDYVWLLTVAEYADFELKVRVQAFAGRPGNSGIQLRSRYDEKAEWLDGPQVDINPPGPWRNGFIYDETREVKKWLSPIMGPPQMAKPEHAPKGWKWAQADKEDLWNDVHIICKGTRIRTVVNGVPVVDYDGAGHLDDDAHQKHGVGMKGHIGLQIHPGDQLRIRFKDLQLKRL